MRYRIKQADHDTFYVERRVWCVLQSWEAVAVLSTLSKARAAMDDYKKRDQEFPRYFYK